MDRVLSNENISVMAWDSGSIWIGEEPDHGTTLGEVAAATDELAFEPGWKVRVHELSNSPSNGNTVRFIWALW